MQSQVKPTVASINLLFIVGTNLVPYLHITITNQLISEHYNACVLFVSGF